MRVPLNASTQEALKAEAARLAAIERKELLLSLVQQSREAVRDGNKVRALNRLDQILIMLNAGR